MPINILQVLLMLYETLVMCEEGVYFNGYAYAKVAEKTDRKYARIA